MKLHCLHMLGWLLRLLAWAALILVIIPLARDYRGVATRAQVSRLTFPVEARLAKQWLLRQPAILSLNMKDVTLDGSFCIGDDASLWQTIVPEPVAIRVVGEGNAPLIQQEATLVLGRSGELLGAPVVQCLPSPAEFEPFPPLAIETAGVIFVAVSGIAHPVASGDLAEHFRVYRVAFPTSELALCVSTKCQSGFLLRSTPSGQAGIELVVQYMSSVSLVVDSLATFHWDANQAGFVLPPPDSAGLWRASQDESVFSK